MHHSEEKDIFHTHPWSGISFIFGSYSEEKLLLSSRKKQWFNWVKATVPHRVSLPDGPVWSLFIHGRRCNRWQVVHRDGHIIDTEPWRGVGGRTSYEK